MRGTLILSPLLLLAGCLTPEEPAALSVNEPLATEMIWSDEPWALALPEGDSFGVVRITNLSTHKLFDTDVYGLVVDASALEGVVSVAFYRADGGIASTDAEGWGLGSNGAFPFAFARGWSEDPGEVIIVVAAHATKRGEVLIGPWLDNGMSIDGEPAPREWHATGPAEVSYYVSGILVNELSIEDTSYGFTISGTGLPPNGLAAAGLVNYATRHAGAPTPGLEYADSILLVSGAGAGTLETTLVREEDPLTTTAAFAAPTWGLLQIAGGSIGATALAGTSLNVGLTGAATIQSMILRHSSVPFDFAGIGLRFEDSVEAVGVEIPTGLAECQVKRGYCTFFEP